MKIMTHKEKALDYFDRKFHCSQAVLAANAVDVLEQIISETESEA